LPSDAITLTGTLLTLSGQPAPNVRLHLGASASARPPLGGSPSGTPQPYPPPPSLPAPPPAPVPLYAPGQAPAPPAGLSESGVSLVAVTVGADGTFTCSLPSPRALCYAAGARTDADTDPARGGRWAAVYLAVLPTGRVVPLALDPAASGTLDITALLCGPGL